MSGALCSTNAAQQAYTRVVRAEQSSPGWTGCSDHAYMVFTSCNLVKTGKRCNTVGTTFMQQSLLCNWPGSQQPLFGWCPVSSALRTPLTYPARAAGRKHGEGGTVRPALQLPFHPLHQLKPLLHDGEIRGYQGVCRKKGIISSASTRYMAVHPNRQAMAVRAGRHAGEVLWEWEANPAKCGSATAGGMDAGTGVLLAERSGHLGHEVNASCGSNQGT